MLDTETNRHVKSPRARFAETTSSIGAGLLGIGLGVLFARHLNAFGMAFLVLGALMHAWGMFDMRRMESRRGTRGWSQWRPRSGRYLLPAA